MTTAQRNDIEVSRYFIPDTFRHIPITEQDEERYLASSERGTEKWNQYEGVKDGFDALSLGKSRRGLNIDLAEQAIIEGTIPYWTLLGGEETPIPESVATFYSRELFKGKEKERIMQVYQTVIDQKMA